MTSTPEGKTICIITQSHLCQNPRALKEAIALAVSGYHIYVLTGILTTGLFSRDQAAIAGYPISYLPVFDLSKRTWKSIADRALNKFGKLLVRFLHLENPLALGYGSYRYYRESFRLNADLYICHQELATYTGTILLRKGFNVAFDLEDWYSEDLLSDTRLSRPLKILRKSESIALTKGIYSTTTSGVLARKLAETYYSRPPATIYNVFPSEPRLLELEKNYQAPLKLFWFSQTIGPGRGIEEFIALLHQITPKPELHLLGQIDPAYKAALQNQMPEMQRLFFHNPVNATELPMKIAEFDIGLALELTAPQSRNYTITNKFFQYLQSGLPVIASKTAGQCEGFEKFQPGFMLSENLRQDAAPLGKWLNDPDVLIAARKRACAAAMYYNWENESFKIVNLAKEAIEKLS